MLLSPEGAPLRPNKRSPRAQDLLWDCQFRPTPYVSHQALFDPTAPHGLGYYWKSEYVPSLSDALIDTLAERAWGVATPESYKIIFHLGGAVG